MLLIIPSTQSLLLLVLQPLAFSFSLCKNRSAVFLDVIAITALIIYVTRVVLGYKQTTDRYQVSSLPILDNAVVNIILIYFFVFIFQSNMNLCYCVFFRALFIYGLCVCVCITFFHQKTR